MQKTLKTSTDTFKVVDLREVDKSEAYYASENRGPGTAVKARRLGTNQEMFNIGRNGNAEGGYMAQKGDMEVTTKQGEVTLVRKEPFAIRYMQPYPNDPTTVPSGIEVLAIPVTENVAFRDKVSQDTILVRKGGAIAILPTGHAYAIRPEELKDEKYTRLRDFQSKVQPAPEFSEKEVETLNYKLGLVVAMGGVVSDWKFNPGNGTTGQANVRAFFEDNAHREAAERKLQEFGVPYQAATKGTQQLLVVKKDDFIPVLSALGGASQVIPQRKQRSPGMRA